MPEFTFTLHLQGDPEGVLDALFKAGCGDALFGSIAGAWYADFMRESTSFEEAVRSAIAQIESVPGLKVGRDLKNPAT